MWNFPVEIYGPVSTSNEKQKNLLLNQSWKYSCSEKAVSENWDGRAMAPWTAVSRRRSPRYYRCPVLAAISRQQGARRWLSQYGSCRTSTKTWVHISSTHAEYQMQQCVQLEPQCKGGPDRKIPEDFWPASPFESMSSEFHERSGHR